MKKVEIYDQYKAIYSDPEDLTSLIHSPTASTMIVQEELSNQEAVDLVTSLYESSKTLGESYSDVNLNLPNAYAELRVYFSDGRVLTRVIHAIQQ